METALRKGVLCSCRMPRRAARIAPIVFAHGLLAIAAPPDATSHARDVAWSLRVECRDEQSVDERDDGSVTSDFDDNPGSQSLSIELALRERARRSGRLADIEVHLVEARSESGNVSGQDSSRSTTAESRGLLLARSRRQRESGEFQTDEVEPRSPGVREVLPAGLVSKILGSLVVREPAWERDAATLRDARVGRWRRFGDHSLLARVERTWTRDPPLPDGLRPISWTGRMTILEPSPDGTSIEVGSGSAAERGLVDSDNQVFREIDQRWDAEFEVESLRVRWRHRCLTRLAPRPEVAPPPPTPDRP